MAEPHQSRLSPGAKLALELGPLLIYLLITFKVHERFGLDLGQPVFRPAVIWLIISTPIQVGILWWGERKIPWSPAITAVFLIGFGLLSLALEDDRWIKVKPSIVYVVFAAAIGVGLIIGRPLLKLVLGSQINASDAKWNSMSRHFTIFFIVMAVLNVAVWLVCDAIYGAGTDASFQAWSTSKIFFMVASMVFSMWQMWPILQQAAAAAEQSKPND